MCTRLQNAQEQIRAKTAELLEARLGGERVYTGLQPVFTYANQRVSSAPHFPPCDVVMTLATKPRSGRRGDSARASTRPAATMPVLAVSRPAPERGRSRVDG